MENFFYNDNFCTGIEDLLTYLDLDDESDIMELEDDWYVDAEETDLEKMFVLDEHFIVNAIMEKTDKWEERFPEDCEKVDNDISKAIKQSFDLEKLNRLIPNLHYANGKMFKITKQDLLNY